MKSFKGLIVWQKSIELVKEIYKITNNYPKEEIYGLKSQMRRAVISIPSNIAEGYGRKGTKDYIRFLGIAKGSVSELETQVVISKDLYKDVDFEKVEFLVEEIQKMLASMINKLNNKN